jgi:hypothetical protein
MKEAQIEGDFLPWRDFLHEGPVPANLTLEELSLVRANFIANYGFGTLNNVKKDFEKRDKKLNNYKLYDKVVLWFEHDLYDQLQLLQILSWFATQDLETTKLTLICTNNYLAESSVQQIKKLLRYETPIMKEHFSLAQEAWLAFRHDTPEKWTELLEDSIDLLPFLKSAIYRMIEEYPSTKHGLSRTAYQALLVISNGINDPMDIFTKGQSFEKRKFMGDVIFWKILDEFETYGLIEKREAKLYLTSLGKELIDGQTNWININSTFQRSIGGVNLSIENLWCWDNEKKSIKKYYYSKPLKSLLKIK